MATMRYCPTCDDVLETCEHLYKKGYSAAPAIHGDGFKPGYSYAVNQVVHSKKQLYEVAARKGITIFKDQFA